MASLSIKSTMKLSTRNTIPMIGFGVWASPNHLTTKSSLEALKVGYRHIDTAQVYGNEAEVGKAIAQADLPREDIFVTSKIMRPDSNHESTVQKLLDSVHKIAGKDGYLDLMLIHNVTPGAASIKVMWQAMEDLHKQGRLKAIGVSNFGIAHIEQMRQYAKVWPPAVNQLELHPWCQQREIVDYCVNTGIAVEAYCPLVRNQKANDPTLLSIANKHGVSTQQVLVRYCLEKGWIPLPKSDNPERIAKNADVFGFVLDKEDMKSLDGQPQESPLVVAVDNKSTA